MLSVQQANMSSVAKKLNFLLSNIDTMKEMYRFRIGYSKKAILCVKSTLDYYLYRYNSIVLMACLVYLNYVKFWIFSLIEEFYL